MYLFVRWLSKAIIGTFFKEVNVLGLERVPLFGPVIFVGNHSNQFVDAAMLIAAIPRKVQFLIAESSLKRKIIGRLASTAGCIGVRRPQDMRYSGLGRVTWEKGSNILMGIKTRFCLDVKKGDVVSPMLNSAALFSLAVKEVISETEVELIGNIPIGLGTEIHHEFRVTPKIDQCEVFEAVAQSLTHGNSIGIFPEGGSHDRTTLLPLKPGVAIMALDSVLAGAEDVFIIPVGLSYYEAHKIQSKAVFEIARPIQVEEEMALAYQNADREGKKAIVSTLLAEVEKGMRSCFLNAKNYETLKVVKLCTTLYAPERVRLTSDCEYAMMHFVSKLLWKYENDEVLEQIKREVKDYGYKLRAYGILDSEVWQLKQPLENSVVLLLKRIFAIFVALLIGLPVAVLWAPLRMTASYLAEKHRRVALKNSSVKISGRDVLASYKIICSLILLPTANLVYGLCFGLYCFRTWLGVLLSMAAAVTVLPYCYYVSLMKIESLKVLFRQTTSLWMCILNEFNIWRDTERELITSRIEMQLKLRNKIHELIANESELQKELDSIQPRVLIDADSRRLMRRKCDFTPLQSRKFMARREEIL